MPRQIKVERDFLTFPGNGGVGNTRWVSYMKNASGGAVAPGDVVVLDTTEAKGFSFTTTTNQDDPKTIGMAIDNIADGVYGRIQHWGWTDLLKVNGTTDIAAGDSISSFTSAKIAGKATAGTAGKFAFALEAYTANDSSGVIDAWLTGFPGMSTSTGEFISTTSADSAAAADQVSFGRYEIGAGNTVIALSQETAVAADADETKFSNKVQVRINGATYFIMLTVS